MIAENLNKTMEKKARKPGDPGAQRWPVLIKHLRHLGASPIFRHVLSQSVRMLDVKGSRRNPKTHTSYQENAGPPSSLGAEWGVSCSHANSLTSRAPFTRAEISILVTQKAKPRLESQSDLWGNITGLLSTAFKTWRVS